MSWNPITNIKELIADFRQYLDARYEYEKVKMLEKAVGVMGAIAGASILVVFGLLVFFSLLLTLGFGIGAALDNRYWLGFLIVTVFFAGIGALLFFFRKPLIIKPATDALIKAIYGIAAEQNADAAPIQLTHPKPEFNQPHYNNGNQPAAPAFNV